MQFPANYPEKMKKYGYPPPFPPGYPPEQYEKYGYPPSLPDQQNHSSRNYQQQQQQQQQEVSVPISNEHLGTPVVFPWGPGTYMPIAGNVYNSGFNTNQSGTQTVGDVKVGNHGMTTQYRLFTGSASNNVNEGPNQVNTGLQLSGELPEDANFQGNADKNINNYSHQVNHGFIYHGPSSSLGPNESDPTR